MRPRQLLTSVATCTALLVLSACGTQAGTQAGTGTGTAAAAAGATAGERVDLGFTATTVAGAPFDGADLAGSPTVLWFWAPWCSACRAQVPGVGELAAEYGDEVDVVGVGSLDDQDAIASFAADVSPEVTLLADADGVVWRHLGVTAQSTYLVVDADGREVASGALSDAELASTVADLVG